MEAIPPNELETPAHPGLGHETTDIGVKPLVVFVIVLVVSLATVALVLRGLMGWYAGRQEPTAGAITFPPLARTGPVEPLLQKDPAIDMTAMRERDRERLGTFGWVDRKAGVVRIPIDEAMSLVVERGLPARKTDSRDD